MILRTLLGLGVVLVASFPLAIIATLLLIPFWRWLEETTGIESIGHSGPAEWCFVLLFAIFVLGGLALLFQRTRRA